MTWAKIVDEEVVQIFDGDVRQHWHVDALALWEDVPNDIGIAEGWHRKEDESWVSAEVWQAEVAAAEEVRHVNGQYAALEAAHTDWKDVVKSESFVDWLQQQPTAIQQLSNSNDAFEASKLLDYYKMSQPREDVATTSTVTSLQQKRAKQLQDSTGVKSKPGPGATGVIPPDDFDTAFEMFAADNR